MGERELQQIVRELKKNIYIHRCHRWSPNSYNESSEQGTGVAVRCSLAGQGSGGLEEGGSVEETEFFGGLEAGTGLGRGFGHLVVATDEGLGELLLERFQDADKGRPLGKGAGVFRTAGLVESALVTDADAATVEGTAMGSHLVVTAVLGDGAILADVEVVADVEEAAGEVVATELGNGVVAVATGGGTVDDEVTDGGGGHRDAGLYTGEEVVLGGDGVAGNGHGVLFCNHSFFCFERELPEIIRKLKKIILV